jgi:signal recognition particle receptor subunit alpha
MISVKELAAPLLAIQSNADHPATSDDNTGRTPGDSPLLAPAIPARLKKQKGKKGKKSPYQSRYRPFKYQFLMGSGDEAQEAKAKGKKGRKWGDAGAYEADSANEILDFSSAPESTYVPTNIDAFVSSNRNDFDLESDGEETPTNRGWRIFSNFIGGKVLTKEDLKEPLEQMHQFLLAKNVANEVSLHVCESVEKSVIGQKTGNFESTKNSVRKAINDSLTRILTPTKPTDLLHEIAQISKTEKRPYTISFVGVNGVGKSTNLSKIAFKLLNNGNSVLIAACDTFRSGAVEQLRKHVVNLRQWVERKENGVKIELFERGYGKDAADVAANAVKFALAEGFDVVLIDTAGRRHNDQALMGSLTKVHIPYSVCD